MRKDEVRQIAQYLTVTVARAMELTGLGRSTLYELMRDGKIERIKVGKRTLILYRSLVEFLQGSRSQEHSA